MNRQEAKKIIIDILTEIVKNKTIIVPGLDKQDAYGHAAGTPAEEWVKDVLNENGLQALYPNEFVVKILKSERARNEILKKAWWTPLLVSKKQLKEYDSNGTCTRWQQEGADIVVFFGDDFKKDYNEIILINVKSHDLSRASRAPNIMSVMRIMEFMEDILSNKPELLPEVDLLFVGVYYDCTTKGGVVRQIPVKDLFKLDVSKIAQINFDAALQLQWHVKDMIEIEQTKEQFIRALSQAVYDQWTKHVKGREKKIIHLVSSIEKRTSGSP